MIFYFLTLCIYINTEYWPEHSYSSVLNCREWGAGSNKQGGGCFGKISWNGGVIIKWPSGNVETIPSNGRKLITKWEDGGMGGSIIFIFLLLPEMVNSSGKWSDPGHLLMSQGKFFLLFLCTPFLHIFDI